MPEHTPQIRRGLTSPRSGCGTWGDPVLNQLCEDASEPNASQFVDSIHTYLHRNGRLTIRQYEAYNRSRDRSSRQSRLEEDEVVDTEPEDEEAAPSSTGHVAMAGELPWLADGFYHASGNGARFRVHTVRDGQLRHQRIVKMGHSDSETGRMLWRGVATLWSTGQAVLWQRFFRDVAVSQFVDDVNVTLRQIREENGNGGLLDNPDFVVADDPFASGGGRNAVLQGSVGSSAMFEDHTTRPTRTGPLMSEITPGMIR